MADEGEVSGEVLLSETTFVHAQWPRSRCLAHFCVWPNKFKEHTREVRGLSKWRLAAAAAECGFAFALVVRVQRPVRRQLPIQVEVHMSEQSN